MNFKFWKFLCSIFAIFMVFSNFINAELVFTKVTSRDDMDSLITSMKGVCSETVKDRNSTVFLDAYVDMCFDWPKSIFIYQCTDDDKIVGMFIVDKLSYPDTGDLRLSELLVRKGKYGDIDKVMTEKILKKIKTDILPKNKKLIPETAVYKCYEFYFNPQVENNKNKNRSNSIPKSKK